MASIIHQGPFFPTMKNRVTLGHPDPKKNFNSLSTCLFLKALAILIVRKGRGSKERYLKHHKSISEDHTNNWWRPQIAIINHFRYIYFFPWINESVFSLILAYKLTWANFTKNLPGVSQNHGKHCFDHKKLKFEQKKFLSTLLYENLPLWSRNPS
jgi:hypothetical protein